MTQEETEGQFAASRGELVPVAPPGSVREWAAAAENVLRQAVEKAPSAEHLENAQMVLANTLVDRYRRDADPALVEEAGDLLNHLAAVTQIVEHRGLALLNLASLLGLIGQADAATEKLRLAVEDLRRANSRP